MTFIVKVVIRFAPLGSSARYLPPATTGFETLWGYAQLLLVLVGCMLLVALVINPLLVFWKIRRNPYPLVLTCLRESGVYAFFTRSSAANIPVNMALCEKLNLDRDTYSVSIPLGRPYGWRGNHHHRADAGGGAYAEYSGGSADGAAAERGRFAVRLRRLRRGGRLAAADPAGL